MYKSRFPKWDIRKNNKESDMSVILRKKTQRDAIGKPSSFCVRGKPVEFQNVMRYFKRKGTKRNPAFRVASPSVATPPYIVCSTPSPVPLPRASTEDGQEDTASPVDTELWELAVQIVQYDMANVNKPEEQRLNQDFDRQDTPQYLDIQPFHQWSSLNPEVPRTVSPPQVLLLPEQFFTTIKTYFSGSFGNKTWVLDEQGYCVNIATLAINVDLNTFCGSITLAGDLMNQRSFVEGRQVLSRACAHIENILRAEQLQTLYSLLGALLDLKHKGLVEVAAQIQRYIGKMAASILSEGHSWSLICRLLEFVTTNDLESVSTRSWQCILEVFEQELGLFNLTTLRCRTTFITRTYSRDLVGAERQLRELLLGCKQHYGTSDLRYLEIMHSLVHSLYMQEQYTEVEILGEELLKRAQEGRAILYKVFALEVSAYAQCMLDKVHLAEKNMREAIEILTRQYGRQQQRTIRYKSTLEAWLREWGRDSEADELRKDVVEWIGPDELTD